MAKLDREEDFDALKIRARHRLIGTGLIALILVSVIPLLINHPRALEKPVAEPEPRMALPRVSTPPSIEATAVTVAPVSTREPAPATPLGPAPTVVPPLDTHSGSGPRTADASPGLPPIVDDKATPLDTKAPSIESARPDESKTAKVRASERGWFVQVGVFSEEARAQDLKSRLKEKGIDAAAEAIHGRHGPMTRVRLGPFQEKAAASVLLARVRDLGENAILVHQ